MIIIYFGHLSSTHHTFIVWPHYLAKQTLLLISVLSVKWMGTLQSQRHGVGRSISYGEVPDIWAICRHYRWTLQQNEAPVHTAQTTKIEHINFIEPHMWPPNSPDINPVDYAIWGARHSATSLPPTTIQDGERTEASDSHWVAKTLTAFHW